MPTKTLGRDALLSQPSFAPYTDDPEQGLGIESPEPATMLQTQRLLMDGTCALLASAPIANKSVHRTRPIP